MLKIWKLNLQLFGEGGDGGGDSAGEGIGDITGEVGLDAEESRIPERARKFYDKAKQMHQPKSENKTQTTESDKPTKLSYADMIKSDDYKEDHQAYMEKTISDRLKKYKGMEESYKKMSDALSKVGNKYGLDVASESFLDDLSARIGADNSYYEDYAMEHDMSVDDAKEILDLKNEVSKRKAEEARQAEAERLANEEAEKNAAMQKELQALRASAEQTKGIYPSFNLEAEMQDEKFRHICAVLHGDTLAAYRACHHDDLMKAQGYAISQRANIQASNAIASNKSRPIENGLSSQATTVTSVDWSKASLSDIRAYAAEQRKITARR